MHELLYKVNTYFLIKNYDCNLLNFLIFTHDFIIIIIIGFIRVIMWLLIFIFLIFSVLLIFILILMRILQRNLMIFLKVN
jgi:hypothetical protein